MTSNSTCFLVRWGLSLVHTFEVYEGNYGNCVKERFETKVLPFFPENLNGQASQGSH
jgi:hypothetical protein